MPTAARQLACSALAVLFACLGMSPASAFQVRTTGTGAEIKWPSPSAVYFVNPDGGPAGALSSVTASLQTWTDVPSSAFEFVYGGTTTSTSGGGNDGTNLILFRQLLSDSIAVTFTWYDTVTGEIRDSDILLSTNYSWSAAGAPGLMDVRNIVTHETGHMLSLEDLFLAADTEKTMYGFASAGETKKRTLDPDDAAGISHLYPLPAGTIRVVSPNGGESFEQGSTHDISWSSSGNAGPLVRIELVKGGTVNSPVTSGTENDGVFAWSVPPAQTPGTDYRIRITSTSDGSIADGSDGIFAIIAPPPPAATLTDLFIAGPSSVNETGSVQYVATASWSDGSTATVVPAWSVSPATYASIGAGGVLTTLSVPSDQPVTVSASYSSGGVTKTASQGVTIVDVPDADGDGVPDTEEMGPGGADGNYDGNGDGVPDGRQENVASLHTFDGAHYVTIECAGSLDNVAAAATPEGAPASVDFPYGVFGFAVTGFPPGAPVAVRILLDGSFPDIYYKYGPLPGNPQPQWYEFLFENPSRTGATIAGFEVALHFVDGSRGDDDLAADGVIVDQGGPGVTRSSPPPPTVEFTSGGGGCAVAENNGGWNPGEIDGSFGFLILAILWLAMRRRGRSAGR